MFELHSFSDCFIRFVHLQAYKHGGNYLRALEHHLRGKGHIEAVNCNLENGDGFCGKDLDWLRF